MPMAWALGPMYLRRSKDGLRSLLHLYHVPLLRSKAGPTPLPGVVPEVRSGVRYFAKLVSFPLAQTGEGISECELVAWAVKPGDMVSPFDKLCDVQSDKAAIEITSRYGGKVLALHHAVGAMVKVGAPLVEMEVADDVQVAPEHLASALSPASTAAVAAAAADAAKEPPAVVTVSATQVTMTVTEEVAAVTAVQHPGTLPSASATAAAAAATPYVAPARPSTPLAPPSAPPSPSSQSSPLPSPRPPGRARALASPAVRAYARELGLDLGMIAGSGPSGRITRVDVEQYVEQLQQQGRGQGLSAAAEDGDDDDGVVLQASDFLGQAGPAGAEAAAAAAAGGHRPPRGRAEDLLTQYKRLARGGPAAGGGVGGDGVTSVIPLRGYRRAMVASMTAAAALPVFHFHDEVVMDRLLVVREALRGDPGLRVRLTVLPIIIKALSVALTQHPQINASLAPSGTDLLLHSHHNIGVAMATSAGLVVPNIKQVERKSVAQVASELQLLHQLAAVGRLPQEALSGGTITISNIGTIGGTYATPLVTAPEVAIVALGRMQVLPRYPGPAGPPTGGSRWPDSASVPKPVPVSLMPVSWGADHRVVDGAALAAFSNTWKWLLEEPDRLLLHLV